MDNEWTNTIEDDDLDDGISEKLANDLSTYFEDVITDALTLASMHSKNGEVTLENATKELKEILMEDSEFIEMPNCAFCFLRSLVKRTNLKIINSEVDK